MQVPVCLSVGVAGVAGAGKCPPNVMSTEQEHIKCSHGGGRNGGREGGVRLSSLLAGTTGRGTGMVTPSPGTPNNGQGSLFPKHETCV